jgi:hypothetical protein
MFKSGIRSKKTMDNIYLQSSQRITFAYHNSIFNFIPYEMRI